MARLDVVVGVRGAASEIVSAAAAGGIVSTGRQALFVDSPQQAGSWLREHLRPGDAVLLKASRGVRLEQALAELDL
jgi:UDP-N-acetylmuramoyl-tripeptide--D-alanyl-D-alanine ligase